MQTARFTVYAASGVVNLEVGAGDDLACYSTLVREVLGHVRQWCVVSPWLTRREVNETENLLRWQEMRVMLYRTRAAFHDALWVAASHHAPAFFVLGIGRDDAMELARRFDQPGVLWVERESPRLLDVWDGAMYPCRVTADRMRLPEEQGERAVPKQSQLRFTMPPPPTVIRVVDQLRGASVSARK